MTLKGMFNRMVLVSLAAATACSGGDSTDPGNESPGSLSVTVATPALSIAQGSTGSVTVTIGRTGSFAGAVAVTVQGAPANVNATTSPATVAAGSTTTTIDFAVGASAAVGTSTVTVRASGTGVAEKTTTIALTVTAAAPQGGYTIALSPGTVSVAQGGQGSSTATLTRTGGYAGEVTFSASGAPAGMTLSFSPPNTTGTTTTVGVAVAASVAPNTYPITIRGAAAGVSEQTATLNVTVTPSSPGGGNTTYRFCTAVLFAATQDGSGSWTARTVSNDRVTFDVASGKGGVAYVTGAGANAYSTVIHYGTQAELNAAGGQCAAATGNKTVNGTVANVGLTDVVFVGLGGAAAFVVPALGSGFTLQNVPDGTIDLAAARVTQNIGGTAVTQIADRAIVRRGLNPAANSTLPVLDFNAAESIATVMRTLSLGNLSGDAAIIQESYRTAGSGTVPLYNESEVSAQATRQVPTLPNAPSGDLHLVTVIAGNAPFTTNRSVTAWFRNSADMTVTLGPALGPVTVTAAATSPTALLRAQYTLQSQYPMGLSVNYSQDSGATSRSVMVTASGGYLAGSTAFDHTMPDFSPLTGWNNVWGFVTGAQTQWSLTATTFTGTGGVLDGVVTTTATRGGTITP